MKEFFYCGYNKNNGYLSEEQLDEIIMKEACGEPSPWFHVIINLSSLYCTHVEQGLRFDF